MTHVRTLAGALLLASGGVRVAQLFAGRAAVETAVTVVFATACLAIGGWLVRCDRKACLVGVAVPTPGLLLAVAGMRGAPSALGAFFVAVDVIAVGCCPRVLATTRRATS